MVWPITIAAIIIFLALAGVVAWSIGDERERRSRYLSVISRAHAGQSKEDSSDKNLVKQRADLARKLKESSRETQEKKRDKTSIKQMLQVAGIEAPVSHYWIFSAIFAVIVAATILPTSWPMMAKVFIIITAFLGVPKLFLKWKAARRQKRFLESFADALDAMARLLQAGMPISEAIAMGSREFSGPLKEELLRVYENQKVGIPLGEATLMMARRIPLTEVHMFAAALQIQSETGSSLSEVLSNLSGVIRARFRLRRKVKALSSEARSSAAIIAALPILVTLGLYATRPEYIGILFITPKGKLLLAGAGMWMSFGVLIMRQMINFRI
ncbi:MAG: type II secretion system F family protein [Alphaproteobacteria bacterium]|nr:type II secretion system F family protein [Alphaproteobacteria bacterium]